MGGGVLPLVLLLSLGLSLADNIEVHILPHSHCDPGWLHTVDEYFQLQVNDILNSVTNDLYDHPSHRFVWSEVSYFQRWWDAADETMRARLKSVVANGRMEFIMGGWVMSDEACPTLDAVINNFQTGHDYLLETIGVIPRWGWQIDPFGASALSPLVYSLMGYEGAVFDRVDQRLVNNYSSIIPGKTGSLLEEKAMQFYWKPSSSYPDVALFSHIMEGGYCSPGGWSNKQLSNGTFGLDFDGDPLQNQNPHVQVNDENVAFLAKNFVATCAYRAQHMRTPHLLMPFGCDFRWRNATINYSNMDKLLNYLQSNPNVTNGMTFRYSTLSDYMVAVKSHPNVDFPVKEAGNDFLPYDTCWAEPDLKFYNTCIGYWSGYYSSRPIIKLESRRSEDRLRVLEQLSFLLQSTRSAISSLLQDEIDGALRALRRAVGLVQHHDAITGTMRAHVLDDYMARLHSARSAAENVIASMLQLLHSSPPPDDPTGAGSGGAALSIADGIEPVVRNRLCTGCVLPLVVYNSLGWSRSRVVSVPCFDLDEVVADANGVMVESEIIPRTAEGGAPFTLYFRASTPPMGSATFFVSRRADLPSTVATIQVCNDTTTTLSNGKMEVDFKMSASGAVFLDRYHSADLSATFPLEQSFNFYDSQGDGAYTLRPTSGIAEPVVPTSPNATVVRGRLVSEVKQQLTDLIDHTVRIYHPASDAAAAASGEGSIIEVKMTNLGVTEIEELVTRFSTEGVIDTKGSFWTGNGLEMLQRNVTVRAGDEYSWNTVAGNYYPMLPSAFIQDKNLRLTVHGRQVMGVSMTKDGSLEVMLHRRSITDDGRGLLEALDDTARINVTLWLTLNSPETSDNMHHRVSLELNHPLEVFIGGGRYGIDEAHWKAEMKSSVRFLQDDLPDDIHVLSLSPRGVGETKGVMRLQNLKSVRMSNAKPESINLDELFSKAVNYGRILPSLLTLINETTEETTPVTGNQILNPLQIRTFAFVDASSSSVGAGDYLVYALCGGAAVVVIALASSYVVRKKTSVRKPSQQQQQQQQQQQEDVVGHHDEEEAMETDALLPKA